MEATNSIVTLVLAIFSAVGDWFISAVNSMMAIFYTNGELTVIGALSVCGLAVATILLVLAFIRGFFHWRS